MFNIFRRKKREDKPTPPWLIWLVIIFLGYSILSNRNPDSDVRKSVEKAASNIEAQKLFDIEGTASKIFPETSPELRIKEIAPGSGNPAVCGQELSVAYSAQFGNGVNAKEAATKEAPLVFRLGERKEPAIFEEGLIGLQKGGKRSVIAPLAQTSFDLSQSPSLTPDMLVKLDAELLDIRPGLPPINETAYRISPTSQGSGMRVMCGDTVKVHVTLWSVAGKKLYSTQGGKDEPVIFTAGKSEVFLGLEQGVIGMRTGGSATLIVPPDFQKTMQGNAPISNFPFPKGETVLVDIETLP